MIFGAFTLVNIWQYNQSCAYTASAGPKCYEVRDPYDLAVVAIALAGALLRLPVVERRAGQDLHG